MNYIKDKLKLSKFRSNFKLKDKDIEYINKVGLQKIEEHAYDFISKRLSDEYPNNDGKQTPMRGHPVFIAQHACACCCRGCLEKWHHIPYGKKLNNDEIKYIVDFLMDWIKDEYKTK